MFNTKPHLHLLPFVIQAAILAFPVFLLAVILNNRYLIFSDATFAFYPGKASNIVQLINPASLVHSAGTPTWIMAGDQLSISARLGRMPESVTIRYTLVSVSQPYLVLQKQTPSATDSYTPIAYSSALDELSWPHLTKGPLTLWKRPERVATVVKSDQEQKVTTPVTEYESLDAIITAGDFDKIAVAGIHPLSIYRVTHYAADSSPRTLMHSFRGSHRLVTYLDHETLSLSFDKIDLNRQSGTDSMVVRVGRVGDATGTGQHWILTKKIGDDGITKSSKQIGQPQKVTILLTDTATEPLAPGVYFIDISTSEDTTFTNLQSTQKYLAFDGRVFLAEGPAYNPGAKFFPVKLTTNSPKFSVAAAHQEGEQLITLGKDKINVNDIKIEHQLQIPKDPTQITLSKGDVIIQSTGQIAFAPFEIFPTKTPTAVQPSTTFNLDPFDYFLAYYQPNQLKKGKSSPNISIEQTYPIKDLVIDGQKKVHVMLSAPGRTASGAVVGVKSVTVTFHRGGFPWTKFTEKINPFF